MEARMSNPVEGFIVYVSHLWRMEPVTGGGARLSQ